MAVVDTVPQGASALQTPQQQANLRERMNHTLLKIIRDNFNTQYASQAPILAGFRDAVSTHGGTDVDATLLADFRTHVPLSSYDSYKPFIDKFNARPCKEQDVEDMFSPGFPDFLALSSATSGTTPKVLPKYNHNARSNIPTRLLLDPSSKDVLAIVACTAYREIKEIERAPGQVVRKIPVCTVSGGAIRRPLGWLDDDDESRLSLNMPGFAAPWAATLIGHLSSLLIIHGLFFLTHRDLRRFFITFAPLFIDLIRHIDEQWGVLLSCIRDGTLPDVDGIDDVRQFLQAQLHADPERAAELHEIGPPFSSEGWVSRVWPNAATLVTICSGPFANVLPRVRSVLGPNVTIRCSGYGSSEAAIASTFANKLDEFVPRLDDFIEFLDVLQDETHENVRQGWEVEVGKQYELILTTRDGLWRYRLGDIVQIVGFDPEGNCPVFKCLGRKTATLRLPHVQITDYQLLEAIRVFQSETTIEVQEFTTMIDDRALPPTVSFLVELMGPVVSHAHLATRKLFDALVSTNIDHKCALEHGQIRLPTIRVLKEGTFAGYREWKGKSLNVPSGQIKVPVVLIDPTVQIWFLERVAQEI